MEFQTKPWPLCLFIIIIIFIILFTVIGYSYHRWPAVMEFSFLAACRCVKLLLYWFLLIWQINFSLSNAFLYILSSKSAYIGNIVSYFYATFFCFWLMVGLAELCLLSSLSCIMPMHNDFTICLSDEPLVSLLSQRFFYQLYTLVPRSCTYRCSHM